MKKAITFLAAVFLSSSVFAGLPAGLNYRATSGFVADGTNETYVLQDGYATIRGGNTFGWTDAGSVNIRDRNSGADRRIAGGNFTFSADTFEFDLPSPGTYNIGTACGDSQSSTNVGEITFKDGSTTLLDINHATASGVYDITNTDVSVASWTSHDPTTTVSQTFATSTLNIVTQAGVGSLGFIAHLYIASAGAAAVVVYPSMNMLGVGGAF